MSSDHFEHRLPHFHPVTTTGHHNDLLGQVGAARSDVPGLTSSEDLVSKLVERVTTATNLSPELTGHYQSLIEGHAASIKPG
jgi:hypothetical protein